MGIARDMITKYGNNSYNMNSMDMMRIALDAVDVLGEVKEYRAPADGMFKVQSNPWMMIIDWDKQLPDLHRFIWEEE